MRFISIGRDHVEFADRAVVCIGEMITSVEIEVIAFLGKALARLSVKVREDVIVKHPIVIYCAASTRSCIRGTRRLNKPIENGQCGLHLSLIHISEPTRLLSISYAV